MKFYNRDQELSKLTEIQRYSQKAGQFTVLIGMRRVGKTMLFHELSKCLETPSLYFFVGRKEESLLCQEFIAEIREKLDVYIPNGMSRFEEIFEFLLNVAKSTHFTLMIDEFQDFARANPSIFSSMQNLWDKYKQYSKMNLIVAGFIYSMMRKLFTDEKEPLFGRADYTIHLKPFKANILKEILTDQVIEWRNDDLLALFSVTGGVARYVELIMKEQSEPAFSREKMYETLISESSFFIDEGNNLLISEFGKKYNVYYSILSCIAVGTNTQSEIEQELGGRSVGMYLKQLVEEYEVIEKLRPIRSAKGTKKVKYQIKNIFLQFWFRYFDRYRAMIELGNYEKLRSVVERDYATYSGKTLEEYFREELVETKEFTEIGSWWNEKDGSDEIDIVAINSIDKKVLIGEVKRNSKKFQKEKFLVKVQNLVNKEFAKYEVETRLFSLEDM